MRGYKSYLKEHIYPVTDAYYIGGIAAAHFERAFDLAAKKKCSPKTKREILRLMGAVLKHAQKLGYIDSVPTHTVEIKPTRAEKIKAKLDADEKPYSPNEIYSLLRAADSLAVDENRQTQKVWSRYLPMVYFLTYTGARISEVRGFPRTDYEKVNGFIRISQSAPETGAVGNVKAVDSIRRIPLNSALIAPLDAALMRHERSLVFGTLTDMPISNSNLYSRLLSPLKDRADILAKASNDPRQVVVSRNRAFHGFRHHYASWLVSAGANLKQLQTYMGHADPAFTLKVYGHLFEDDGKELVANMII